MSGEAVANRAFQWREPGWYVVNRQTRIAVAGPLRSEADARADKAARDERWPTSDDVLVVLACEVPGES